MSFLYLEARLWVFREELLGSYPERCFRIPIIQPAVRSLNLANAVAIVVYEALRQTREHLA